MMSRLKVSIKNPPETQPHGHEHEHEHEHEHDPRSFNLDDYKGLVRQIILQILSKKIKKYDYQGSLGDRCGSR